MGQIELLSTDFFYAKLLTLLVCVSVFFAKLVFKIFGVLEELSV